MSASSVAVISDIHGNRWALEAVLEDIERVGADAVVNLGDCFYGPLDPEGTADLLASLNAPTVLGNEDSVLFEQAPSDTAHSSREFTRERLPAETLDWLRGLPMTLVVFGSMLAFHGTPARFDEYMLHRVEAGGVLPRGAEELAKRLPGDRSHVVLCGHSHNQASLRLPDGRLIVNPGSVGCPAFTDEKPFPHAMQEGTPHARYSILCEEDNEWRVLELAVEYDWNAAAGTALANGSPEWAEWLRTGRSSL